MLNRLTSLLTPPKQLDCIVVAMARFDGTEFAEVYTGSDKEREAKTHYDLWAGDLRKQVRAGERFIKRVVMFHVRDGDVVMSTIHPDHDAVLPGDEANDAE